MTAELDRNGVSYVNLKDSNDFDSVGTDNGDAKELLAAFKMYDLDKNGRISVRELHADPTMLSSANRRRRSLCLVKKLSSTSSARHTFAGRQRGNEGLPF